MNEWYVRRRYELTILAIIVSSLLVEFLFPQSLVGTALGVLTQQGTIEAGLRLAVPIALAAVGGIFAEKSGIINIGLEGLLIMSALSSIIIASVLGSEGGMFVSNVTVRMWLSFFGGVLVSMAFALLFAVVCIEFKADQIIAGLAVWLIALGLAPFVSQVMFGSQNTDTIGTFNNWTVPVLADIPFLGPILFDAPPQVYLMLVSVAVAWYVLNRTAFGRWVVASGENPKALDTAGIDVRRIRYTSVLLSGVFAGMGGAGFALGHLGRFAGGGQTDIQGRGFIAIATYLFGNYNPLGALAASFLFSGLNAMQVRLQITGYAVPSELIRTLPYITVIVVLVLVGRTRIPSAAGEHYDAGED